MITRLDAKQVMRVIICATLALHVILMISEAISAHVGIAGVTIQILYINFVKDFPKINTSSPSFILTCGQSLFHIEIFETILRLSFQILQLLLLCIKCCGSSIWQTTTTKCFETTCAIALTPYYASARKA